MLCSFNGLTRHSTQWLNYTNRSGPNPVEQWAAALGANRVLAKMKNVPRLVGALVPFLAVAAANAINIPMMRSKVCRWNPGRSDKNGEVLGSSLNVPYRAIPQVTISRIIMATPGMVLVPIIFQRCMKMRSYKVKYLEPELQKKIAALKNPPEIVYYNKGL
ncbi:tricarboxylate carrier [Ostertagia ostertagi]